MVQAVLLRMLAQAEPWEEAAPASAPAVKPQRAMSFSDLQQGMRDYNSGAVNDNTFRNGILILIAFIAVVVLCIHFWQRRKGSEAPHSLRLLGWEMSRTIKFGWAAKVLLLCVARSNRVPFAALLLSASFFEKNVTAWANQPTFSVARQWGRGRLAKLKPLLFDGGGARAGGVDSAPATS